MSRYSFEVRPVAGRIGAEIVGVDLAAVQSDADTAALRAALLEWHVLFFRDQLLDPESQRAFAARFGPVTTAHPNSAARSSGRLLSITTTEPRSTTAYSE